MSQFEKLKKLLMRWLPALGEARAQANILLTGANEPMLIFL
jgi:hypothetical protein